MARTLAEQLDAVDAAIEVIESGSQSIATAEGRQLTRGDLRSLYAERRRIEQKIASASGGDFTVAEF